MSYFDELGGEAVRLSAAKLAEMPAEMRGTFLTHLAETMAPTILAQVSPSPDAVRLHGRYGVHGVTAVIALPSAALTLQVRPRRRLCEPERLIHGPARDPSRQLLSELPHGVGDLLNRLLDSFPAGDASLVLRPDELVLQLGDPERMVLSCNPEQRLHSVTHLCAYIATEAETRWPADPNAPLSMPSTTPFERRWTDADGDAQAPPVPLYGMPPPRR